MYDDRLRGTILSGGKQRAWRSRPPASRSVLLTGFAQECGVTPFLLGNGTNLLVADEGWIRSSLDGRGAEPYRAHDGGIITADAGVSLRAAGLLPGSTASRDWSSRTAFPAVSAAAW